MSDSVLIAIISGIFTIISTFGVIILQHHLAKKPEGTSLREAAVTFPPQRGQVPSGSSSPVSSFSYLMQIAFFITLLTVVLYITGSFLLSIVEIYIYSLSDKILSGSIQFLSVLFSYIASSIVMDVAIRKKILTKEVPCIYVSLLYIIFMAAIYALFYKITNIDLYDEVLRDVYSYLDYRVVLHAISITLSPTIVGLIFLRRSRRKS